MTPLRNLPQLPRLKNEKRPTPRPSSQHLGLPGSEIAQRLPVPTDTPVTAIATARASDAMQRAQQCSESLPLTAEQTQIAREIITFLGIRPQTQFTPHVVATWCRVLSIFPMEIVRNAMLECALSTEPFVGLPQIFSRCRQMKAEDVYAPHRDDSKIPQQTLQKVFSVLALDKASTTDNTPPCFV